MTERIGVVGLGRMGSAMAQRMAAMGCSTRGWTRSGRAIDGVETVPDLQTLAAGSDSILLSLFDDAAVAGVLDQLLACDLAGKQIIETSTVVPDVLKDRIAAIEFKGATAVDAPISGGPELVAEGRCGIFIGGNAEAATRASKSLAPISDRIFHVGPLGAGLIMKTINNGMIEAYFNGLHDLMPLAQRAGLTLETALRIVAGGPAGTPFIAARIPKLLGEDETVGFTMNAALKDKDVFDRIAAAHGVTAPTFSHFEKTVSDAIADGHGEDDPAIIVRRAYARGAKA